MMGVVVITLAVAAAYPYPPSAVLVPAERFHRPAFHRDNRGAHRAHHVVAEVPALEAVRPAGPEIVVVVVVKTFRNRRERFYPVSSLPPFAALGALVL